MNYTKTALLLVILSLLLVWMGSLLGGARGALIAFMFALVLNGVSYWYSDKIVLAMYKAHELERERFNEIYEMVGDLSKNAGIPCPRIYMVETGVPNAFATGRNPEKGVLCLTRGIVELLDKDQIRGVISHELAHIRNRDTLIMTVTAALASAIMLIANMARWGAILGGFDRNRRDSGNIIGLLAVSIIAPMAALLVQLAISRSREYGADATGAKIAGNPLGLASALESMSKVSKRYKFDAAPQTAHLFIVSPLRGSFVAGLFSTHPPTEERVKRLRSMA